MNSSNLKSLLARKKTLVNKPSRVSVRLLPPPRDPRSFDDTTSFHVQSLLQNCSNFKSSDVVSRLMYFDGDNWVDFDDSVVVKVMDCFVMKTPMVEVQFGGHLYLFDFFRMLVFQFETRIEVSVAWIDVNDRCFFPKFVKGGDAEFSGFRDVNLGDSDGLGKVLRIGDVKVGELDGSRKLEIEIRVSGSGGGDLLGKRKREGEFGENVVVEEGKSMGSCSNVDENGGKRREVDCSEMVSKRWIKAKVMGEERVAFKAVRNLFLRWAGIKGIGAEITEIHQVTWLTPVDKARYQGFINQVEITKAARGDANVTFAWIKCSSDDVQRILNHGFSCQKASSGEAFGVGIYLSPIRSTRVSVMQPDEGENHAMLCRLILGKCEKIQAGSQQLYPSSPEFDTGVDDVSNPKWYIVWGANMNTHIRPELIISYKHTCNVPGQLSGTPPVCQSSAKPNLAWLPKWSNAKTANLFENLIRSLPSSKVPELRTLCCTYKAGKVPKDIFMKKLRSVVGDQMLRTAIQEVRG